MSTRLAAVLPLLALLVSSVACGGPGASALGEIEDATIQTEEEGVFWGAQSAPGIFGTALLLIAPYTNDELPESACPAVTQEGDVRTVEGGCTDEEGVRWEGRIVFEKGESIDMNTDELPTGNLEFQGWTQIESEDCGESSVETQTVIDGVVRIVKTDDGFDFSLDLGAEGQDVDAETCELEPQAAGYDYAGSAVLTNGNQRHTWNGSGRVGDSENGKASSRTEDEVVDVEACGDGALSGTTTIEAGGDRVVVTYDGETSCDRSAQLSLNGEDLGAVEGVSCATGASGGGLGGLWAVLALGALVLRRRRS